MDNLVLVGIGWLVLVGWYWLVMVGRFNLSTRNNTRIGSTLDGQKMVIFIGWVAVIWMD